MSRLSTSAVEHMAITEFRVLLDEMMLRVPMQPDINENDRTPVWDGCISFYDKDYKKIRYIVDLQIKGRSIGNKRFPDDYTFSDLTFSQLENYKIKGGTILIICLFRKDYKESRLYCTSLLPYNIDDILSKQRKMKRRNPSIKVSAIRGVDDFYNICERFGYDKRMQGGLSNKYFDNPVYQEKYGKTVQFRSYGNSPIEAVTKLLDEDNFFYTLDESGRTVNVSRGKISNIEVTNTAVVKNSSGDAIYSHDNVSILNSEHEELFRFGGSFLLNLTKNNLQIKICGSFDSRLRDLEYLQDVIRSEKIYIDNFYIDVKFENEIKAHFAKLLSVYKKVVVALKKHNINTGINIDNWSDSELNALGQWLEAVEEKKPISVNGNVFGCIQLNELKLSIFSVKRQDGLYDVRAIWNDDSVYPGVFRCDFRDGSCIETSNIFLALPYTVFLADDLNINDAKNNIKWDKLSPKEYNLVNLQALNAIKAYDVNNNKQLLFYAEWLIDNLMKWDEENFAVYFINKQQIKKRLGMMTNKDIEKIINIRERTSVPMAKLCCSLLIDSKVEAKSILRTFSKVQQEDFKAFPISKFLD